MTYSQDCHPPCMKPKTPTNNSYLDPSSILDQGFPGRFVVVLGHCFTYSWGAPLSRPGKRTATLSVAQGSSSVQLVPGAWHP